MSYQNIVNFGTDKHSNPHAVGPAQMTQTVANQQTNLTTSLNPNDKGISSGNTMTGTMQPTSNTRATMINYPNTTINSLNSFYNQPVSNFQSHMRYNAQANANMTRAPNYNASIRMPGQFGGNLLMPHGTKRKQRDPNRPKRPTTAYFYFAQLEREEAAKRGERISKVSEWTKRVAEKWRNLSEEERTQFRASAAEDKTRFDQEMAVYTGKDANKPKRPQSSYFLWLADFRVRMKDKISEHKEILRAAGEEWRKLTLEDKAPYEQLAEEERKKYECRMKEYQETTKRARIDTSSFATGTGSSTSQPITNKVGGHDNVIHHEVDDDSSNEDDDDDDADFSENEE